MKFYSGAFYHCPNCNHGWSGKPGSKSESCPKCGQDCSVEGLDEEREQGDHDYE